MNGRHSAFLRAAVLAAVALADAAAALPAPVGRSLGRPDAIVDLRTVEGAVAVRASWRYRDAVVAPAEHRLPGPDLKPTGAPDRTADIRPRGEAALDDSGWVDIAPTSLEERRSPGLLSFGWYRVAIELPGRLTQGLQLEFSFL